MRTLKNILTLVAISAFLFACEADSVVYEDDDLIEDVKAASGTEHNEAEDSEDSGHEE